MRPIFEVADILRDHLAAYKEQYSLSHSQQKAVQAIMNCRTSALGGHVDSCTSCGYVEISYNSCRNRHCPKCQWSAQQRWNNKRVEELLPVTYFHLVFTLPQELNALVSSNEAKLYGLLFHAAWESVKQLCSQEEWLGAQAGMIAVLHSWGQNLSLHPHLHCIVPGGGLAADGQSWVSSHKKCFLPVRVLSRVFRGKFLHQLRMIYGAGDLDLHGQARRLEPKSVFGQLVRKLYQKEWVVYAKQPFGGPAQVINYLGRYTHRIALSNGRIQAVADGKVTFSYKDYRQQGRQKCMTLDAVEFIRRFLQHCLPPGFQKIRYYGILSTRNRKTKLAGLQRSLDYQPPQIHLGIGGLLMKDQKPVCPACGRPDIERAILPGTLLITAVRFDPIIPCHAGHIHGQRAPPHRHPGVQNV